MLAKKITNTSHADVWVPTACSSCVDGPCLIRVHRVNGVAINIEGNNEEPEFRELTKGRGHVCPKAFGLLQKLYSPHRIKGPLRRTNPEKGIGVEPKWVEISWDEALDIVGERLKEIRDKYPGRLSYGYGTALPRLSSGTWGHFMEAWGPVQQLTSGTSIRCDMAEHNYANLIHGAFQCEPDATYCKYLLLFGSNTSASGGVPEGIRLADARARGLKTVLIDPVLTVTGAKADEWLPIKPGTDAALMLAMIHVIIHELGTYDAEFLKKMTNSPYLVDPNGYFVRHKTTKKVMVWDKIEDKAKAHDDDTIKDFALDGVYLVDSVESKPAHQMLKDHVKQCTPEWAADITDISASTIRRIANEFVDNAMIGSTITIDGIELPYRPVATKIGRGITGVMRSYQCILANHILACLVGALEVPGGHQGGRAHQWDKNLGIIAGPDGMPEPIAFPFTWPPTSYGAVETLVPFGKAYGRLTHLAWRNLVEPPENLPLPPPPEALMLARCNPLVSIGEPEIIAKALQKIPFFVYFAYVEDEMAQFADIILPEHIELERYEASIFVRSALGRKLSGVTLRQPVVAPVCDTMEISDILTELADRIGMLREYNTAINGDLHPKSAKDPKAVLVSLDDPYKLEPDREYTWEEIVDKHCKSITNGVHGLESLKKKGAVYRRVTADEQYDVHLRMKAEKLRYSIPYAEHVKKTGEELAHNLAQVGIDWWPTSEYVPLPSYVPSIVEEQQPEYDFYVTTVRAMQFSTALLVDMPWLVEISKHVRGLEYILMNRAAAKTRGIKDGDEIWVESEVGKVKAKVKLCEGIRPDTLAITGQFGQWATPIAKDTGRVSLTHLLPIRASWTDHMISNMQGHCVKAKVYRA
ncbi:molybdopterin-dependent oxidoreductase [Chloroflexota bacterium]